jgi:hypothetical protein
LSGGENFCGHQQHKQRGGKKTPQKKPESQPFFPLFQVLDQSGCRVEIIFVTTNILLKQAEKKEKKENLNTPSSPYFKSWTNQVAGWKNFWEHQQFAYASPNKKNKQTNKPPFPLFQVLDQSGCRME